MASQPSCEVLHSETAYFGSNVASEGFYFDDAQIRDIFATYRSGTDLEPYLADDTNMLLVLDAYQPNTAKRIETHFEAVENTLSVTVNHKAAMMGAMVLNQPYSLMIYSKHCKLNTITVTRPDKTGNKLF